MRFVGHARPYRPPPTTLDVCVGGHPQRVLPRTLARTTDRVMDRRPTPPTPATRAAAAPTRARLRYTETHRDTRGRGGPPQVTSRDPTANPNPLHHPTGRPLHSAACCDGDPPASTRVGVAQRPEQRSPKPSFRGFESLHPCSTAPFASIPARVPSCASAAVGWPTRGSHERGRDTDGSTGTAGRGRGPASAPSRPPLSPQPSKSPGPSASSWATAWAMANSGNPAARIASAVACTAPLAGPYSVARRSRGTIAMPMSPGWMRV